MLRIAAIVGFVAVVACPLAAMAQTVGGSRSYASLDECNAAGQLSHEMCSNAFANAQAEFLQKTPPFKSREACERAFGRGTCMISICTASTNLPRGRHACGVAFTPRLNGIVVSVASLHSATVRPSVSGKGGIYYAPRTILRSDTGEHPVYASRHGRSGADIPVDALPAGATVDPDSLVDPNPNPTGPVASYPVPAKRLKEMRDRAKSLGLVPP
jgi:uncharacterized protein YgiB involved in biofilm formation